MQKVVGVKRWFRAGLGLAVAAVMVLSAGVCKADEPLIKTGDTLAFMGDSITQQGWGSSSGYVKQVIAGLAANDIKVTPVPAGISGHKSNQMLARLDKDVLSKKPTWMTLSCGVNDVWHGANGVTLEDYKKYIREIVEKCEAANVKVMILTATMIREDAENDLNKKLADYNVFLRELAKEKNLPIADLNADMQKIVAETSPEVKKLGNILTRDGVHMNPLGDEMMATGILKAFGLSEDQMNKAYDAWNQVNCQTQIMVTTTLAEYKKMTEVAIGQKKSLNALLNDKSSEAVKELLK